MLTLMAGYNPNYILYHEYHIMLLRHYGKWKNSAVPEQTSAGLG